MVASEAPVEGDAAPTRVGLQALKVDGTPPTTARECWRK